jgi:uncharacterized protein
MKKLFLLTLFSVFVHVLFAQSSSPNPFPKTISVTGSAELEIIPDEIYVSVMLREYQKKGENKKELEAIKTHFLQSCKAAGIPDSSVSIAAFTGFNEYYVHRKKRKDPNMMASIVYQVKFTDSKTMDALVDRLDDEATQHFLVTGTSHSQVTSIRKQLKIKAVQTAKEKGLYLTGAINEKLGPAISIIEPEEPVYGPINPYANVRLQALDGYAAMEKDASINPQIDFRKIKLKYEVKMVFAIE